MKIWKIRATDNLDNIVEKTFDDSNILLDCICETYDEMAGYMLSIGLGWCKEHELHFISLEIIAE